MTEEAQPVALRLYLNHDVSATAAEALRKRGYDVVAAQELGMSAASDEDHLKRAASDGRTLVSFNVEDYPTLHARFLGQGKSHSGIILSKQLGIKETIRGLETFLRSHTPDQLKDQLLWL